MPRIQRQKHGVLQAKVPWAEPGSGFTTLFKSLAIFWLKRANTKAVAGTLNPGWNPVDGIMQRGVQRGSVRREEH